MNILVTGATGFLGTALCHAIESHSGHHVVRVHSRNCDLTRSDSLAALPPMDYDRIFHLAAWTQAGDFCLRHPGAQWLINQKINTNVLTFWRDQQPQAKLIAVGTSCSYDERLPLVEENYLAGTPIESLFTYAYTKRMLYAGLMALRREFGLRYLQVVPSTLYGPGYHEDGRQMHFIFDLIRKILRGRERGEPVTLWGDGHQRRELIHVDDFVSTMLRLVDRVDDENVNIGTGQDHTIREFAQKICDITGFDSAAIRYDTTRYVGAKAKLLRNEKLLALMPDTRFTPLDSGLRATVEWFLERPERYLRG